MVTIDDLIILVLTALPDDGGQFVWRMNPERFYQVSLLFDAHGQYLVSPFPSATGEFELLGFPIEIDMSYTDIQLATRFSPAS
jgi:HK97 family phage major capsid protein